MLMPSRNLAVTTGPAQLMLPLEGIVCVEKFAGLSPVLSLTKAILVAYSAWCVHRITEAKLKRDSRYSIKGARQGRVNVEGFVR